MAKLSLKEGRYSVSVRGSAHGPISAYNGNPVGR